MKQQRRRLFKNRFLRRKKSLSRFVDNETRIEEYGGNLHFTQGLVVYCTHFKSLSDPLVECLPAQTLSNSTNNK